MDGVNYTHGSPRKDFADQAALAALQLRIGLVDLGRMPVDPAGFDNQRRCLELVTDVK